MPKLHIAILDEELPFPLTSGKRIRTYQLLSRIAERHRFTYLCHRNPDPKESAAAERAMDDLGIRTIVVDRPVPPKRGLGFYWRLFGNLFARDPYSVASHRSKSLVKAIAQLLRDDPPDLIHCEWTPYADVIRQLPAAHCSRPAVIMAHNVESLIWLRLAEAEENPLKRWYIRRQWKKYERFEKWAYSACDCAIAVSRCDARIMREHFAAQRVAVVDNGVDIHYFSPDPTVKRDPKRLLFLGSLDWRPNLDAARRLLDNILPRLTAVDPQVSLDLVGRRPPEWLKQIAAATPNVELHADVADVRPFLHRAGIMVVPLRIGGGSRLKILEALASGLPVVSTTIGAEGLRLQNGVDLRIADRDGEFCAAVHDWIRVPESGLACARNGRQTVIEQYGWDELAERLESIWLKTVGVTIPLQIPDDFALV